MSIKDNIRIALFSIKTNFMRSALTMLGIIIGVSSVIAIITVGDGGRDYIINTINEMGGAAVINISVRPSATLNDFITAGDINAIREISEVEYVSPIVMGFGGIETRYGNGIGITIGGNDDMAYIMAGEYEYGRFFTRDEYLSRSSVAIIDTMSALAIFGRGNCVGESIAYRMNGRTRNLKIIGVMNLMGTFGADAEGMMPALSAFGGAGGDIMSCMMIIPSTLATQMNDTAERYEAAYITAFDDRMLDSVGETARSIIQARHGNSDRNVYSVINMARFVDLVGSVIWIFTIFIASVSGISLVVGGVGVMNIMLVSVTERTREIGIRKALGARTQTILFQFLTESVVICFIGGVVGLTLGVSIAAFVSWLMKVPLSVKLWTVVLAVGFSSAIGMFFGIYPAKKAADMPPIEALRKE